MTDTHPPAGPEIRPLDRRRFLTGGAMAVAGGAALAGPFQGLLARAASAAPGGVKGNKPGTPGRRPFSVDYGPLYPTRDQTTGLELLKLPRGFEYLSFGWTGDPLDDGVATPSVHDGMGAFRIAGGKIALVRNHERTSGHAFAPGAAYNPASGGGNTNLVFNPDRGELIGAYGSLDGCVRNCAGGITPWGTWLSNEETTTTRSGVPHGYIFEVPATGLSDAVALKDMGRFSHEAASVDPVTGYVYETEDAGSTSGFYRFVPNTPGRLTDGGTLQMMKVAGSANADLRGAQQQGATYDVEWVDIDNPDPTAPNGTHIGAQSVYNQGRAKGGIRFNRLEGCWAEGRLQYFVSTNGGAAGQGQIWVHDPAAETLTMVFESPSVDVLNAPDNVAVSPRGGLILCEDGGRRPQAIHGLTPDGEIFRFAENNVVLAGERNGIRGDYRGSESAGACFDPGGGGNWLFFNIQSPGITFAVTGPWRKGAL